MFQFNTKARPGLDDFVLLENYKDKNSFIDNLKVRLDADIIYVIYKLQKIFFSLMCNKLQNEIGHLIL